jgi:peptidoglycan-associated lipoprotein
MKLKIKLTFVLSLAAVALITACSSTPPATPATVGAQPALATQTPAPPTPSAKSPAVASAPAASVSTLKPYLDPKNPLSTQRSVYFDFDDYSIKKEYIPIIELHGRYLASQPSLAIKIVGNADERGSGEYNLALGQRRAEAVAQALRLYGVKNAQVEAISWGKERPKATGHDESAWAQNRRADLAYPAQ